MVTFERAPLLLKPRFVASTWRVSAACVQKVNMATNSSIPTWKPVFAPVEDSSSGSFKEKVSSIRLVTYNILAQSYVKSILFPHSPSPCLKWKARSQAVLARLLSFEADILCLQELDEFESFYKGQLDRQGYSSIYVQRPGKKKDGCGIFYRRGRVSLIEDETVHFNDLVPKKNYTNGELKASEASASLDEESFGNQTDRGDPNDPNVRLKRDCVGIMAAFRAPHALDKIVLLANTHIYWDPDWVDVKLAQAKHLVGCVSKFQALLETRLCSKIPVIICGDFNSMPGDQVYNYLTLRDSVDKTLSESEASVSEEEGKQGWLPLHSLYASVKGEPPFTNCTPDFTGTLDYIFFSSLGTLKPLSLLEVPTAESEDVKDGLPNYSHPSDHLPIGTDFVFV